MVTGGTFPGGQQPRRDIDHYLHLVLGLRISGGKSPLPMHTLIE